MPLCHATQSRFQNPKAQETKRLFDAKLLIQQPVRIADHRKRQILLIGANRPGRGVKDEDLLNACCFDLASVPSEFSDMSVADWTINKAPELQMDKTIAVRNPERLSRNRRDQPRLQKIASFKFHVDLPLMSSPE